MNFRMTDMELDMYISRYRYLAMYCTEEEMNWLDEPELEELVRAREEEQYQDWCREQGRF